MSIITIIGAGMMGSALAFPARENGHTVRLTGTPLDREIIDAARANNQSCLLLVEQHAIPNSPAPSPRAWNTINSRRLRLP